MQRAKFSELFREKELWILLVIGLLYFWRPLLLGETFFFRDLTYDFIPQKQFFAETLRHGELPIWDVYRHGGQPYFADPNNSAFHPSNLLYLILPFFTAFNLTFISHALLSLAGTYLFCRVLSFSRLGSVVAAMSYGFCGYSLSLINLFGRFLAISYLPWLFLFWHLALHERKRCWFALSVACGVLQVLCGAPEVNVISMLLLLGWALLFQLSLKRILALWVVLNIFVLGLSAVQLLPAIEMVQHSSRGEGMDYQEFSSSSLPPKRFPELLLPNFSGSVKLLPYQQYYWGVALTDGDDYPYIISIYIGSLPLIFALWGAVQQGGAESLSRRVRLFLLAVFLASLSLSLGRFLPGFRVLYEHLPLMSLFRYPIKFLLAGLFPFALLAGCGFDRFFSLESSRALRLTLWLLTAFSGTAALLFLFSDSFAEHFMRIFFQQTRNEIMRGSLSTSFWWLFALLFALSLIAHYRRQTPKSWQPLTCTALLCFDLLLAGSSVNVYAAKEFFSDEPPTAQLIRQQIGDGRLYRDDNPENIQLYAPSNDVVWGYRWSLETFDGYLGAFWKLPVIFHDDYVGLGNQHIITLKSAVRSLPWPQKLPLLSAAGVTAILSADPRLGALPGLHEVSEIDNNSNHLFYLYRNSKAIAPVEFISKSRYAESDEQALNFLLQPGYNSRQEVILQDVDASQLGHEEKSSETARIETLRNQSQRQEYTVTTDCEGFLLFSAPLYPGWEVFIDGEPTSQKRANVAFSAVSLRAGTHRITRVYRPLSLIIGTGISLAFCIALGAFLSLAGRKELLPFSSRS